MAKRLGVLGWVRNLADGRVELLACADETKLKKLEDWLWQGPPVARVDAVTASDCPAQSFADFSVHD